MKAKKPKIFKLNKGEWSEVYCLVRTIADGQLNLIDGNLVARSDFIKVVGGKISFCDTKENYEYSVSDTMVEIFTSSEGLIERIDKTAFKILCSNILDQILKTQDKTFTIDAVQKVFSKIGILKLKSDSLTKEDVIFKVSDKELPRQEYLGFSVKSFLAGNPTLINASGATNFIYKTNINKANFAEYKELKAKDLLRKLAEDNQSVTFSKMDSAVYQKNLMLIDTNMPQIIAEILKLYYSGKLRMLTDIVNSLKSSNPLNISDVSIYEHKIKDILFNSALGMFPNKDWDGLKSVDGGCIIISSSGELGTFYIIRKLYLEFFREYLFKNCYLDTASTTRHKFGRLFFDEEAGEYFLKLNLQIRVERKPNE
jgi:hypothetical protein